MAEKEKGNAAFRLGNYAEAVGHYSSAIFADRKDATLPLNRAAAYLKLRKYEDAERDCTHVLILNKSSVKALFRRAQARQALNKMIEAQLDLAEALRIEPANVSVQAELASLRDKVTSPTLNTIPQLTSKRRRVPIEIFEGARPTASQSKNPPPTSLKKSPLKDLPKEAVNLDSLPRMSEVQATEPNKRTSPSPPSETFLTPVSSRSLRETNVVHSSTSPAKPTTRSVINDPTSASVPRNIGGGIFKKTSYAPKAVLEAPLNAKNPDDLLAQRSTRPAPTSLFDLTKNWDAATSTLEKWEIISAIPPSGVKSLFGTSLTPQLLFAMVDVVQEVLDTSTLVPSSSSDPTLSTARTFITVLPSIQRFSTLTMFLGVQEKVRAVNLLKSLGVSKSAWGL